MTNTAWFMCYDCGNHVTEGYWLDIDGEDSTFYCRDCAEERIADGMQREWFRKQAEVSVEMNNYYELAATILQVAGDKPLQLSDRVAYRQLWPGYGALQVEVPQSFVEFRADNVDQLATALRRTVEEYGIPITFMVK